MRRAILLAAIALAGCARAVPDDTRAYVKGVEESAAYHTGYSDGCQTANLAQKHAEMHRDNAAFENDAEYRLGWADGSEKCKDVKIVHPSTPSIRSYN
ncbi:MAG TPA: hypothetical protein VGT78_03120 [Rhizomicrobium sp.]|nr:hypothetical protein [Rhizomicrobium sp.]